MGSGGSTANEVAKYEIEAIDIEQQKAELMAQARQHRDAVPSPTRTTLSTLATCLTPTSSSTTGPLVEKVDVPEKPTAVMQRTQQTKQPPAAYSESKGTAALQSQSSQGKQLPLVQQQYNSNYNTATKISLPPTRVYTTPVQPTTYTTTSRSLSASPTKPKPSLIPTRGKDADSFFKSMIQKYYAIKTDTSIDAIEVISFQSVHSGSQFQTMGTKGKEQYTNRDGASSVHWACYNGDVTALENLLHVQKEDEVRDTVGRTALFYAASRGHIDCCALLMDHHDDWIDIGDRKGDTPLHVATFYQHVGVVRLLLQSAADVNARNKNGYAPLHVALSYEVAALLIEFSADVMAVDKKGRTPLFCACAEKRMECVQYYCEQAHDHPRLVSLADHRGDTPLHAASCNGHTRVVRMLVGAAANVDAKNVRGLTPLELARHNSHPECIAVLEPHTTLSSLPSSQTTSFSSNSSSVSMMLQAGGSASSSASSSASHSYSNSSRGGPQTPKGQQAMRMVYEEQASMEYQPHAGWGGMSERGSQPAASTSDGFHIVSRSERAGYDANQVDPGLARLMAAVSTPGRENDSMMSKEEEAESEAAKISKLESIVGGGDGGGASGGQTADPRLARLAAAVSSPDKQQLQHQHVDVGNVHWISCVDPQSGSLYYKDIISGFTQWEPPSSNSLVNKEWRHESSGVWKNVRSLEIKDTPG